MFSLCACVGVVALCFLAVFAIGGFCIGLEFMLLFFVCLCSVVSCGGGYIQSIIFFCPEIGGEPCGGRGCPYVLL